MTNIADTHQYPSCSNNSASKTHALIAYTLLAVGLFTAIPMIFGGIWAMIKRRSASGTIYHSHYTNAIRTFWWSLFWTIIGCILIVALVGYLILLITWLWALYRVMRGFVEIVADQAYPL